MHEETQYVGKIPSSCRRRSGGVEIEAEYTILDRILMVGMLGQFNKMEMCSMTPVDIVDVLHEPYVENLGW